VGPPCSAGVRRGPRLGNSVKSCSFGRFTLCPGGKKIRQNRNLGFSKVRLKSRARGRFVFRAPAMVIRNRLPARSSMRPSRQTSPLACPPSLSAPPSLPRRCCLRPPSCGRTSLPGFPPCAPCPPAFAGRCCSARRDWCGRWTAGPSARRRATPCGPRPPALAGACRAHETRLRPPPPSAPPLAGVSSSHSEPNFFRFIEQPKMMGCPGLRHFSVVTEGKESCHARLRVQEAFF